MLTESMQNALVSEKILSFRIDSADMKDHAVFTQLTLRLFGIDVVDGNKALHQLSHPR
jgi:hypothetical protein